MKLNEVRSSNIMEIISELKTLKFIDKILDVRGMTDGFTVYIRGNDGNAYELQIRPAAFAKDHEDLRKADKYTERKMQKMNSIRNAFKL